MYTLAVLFNEQVKSLKLSLLQNKKQITALGKQS